jgi:virulence factor BrkB
VQQPDVVTERERHAPGGPESPSDVPMSRWRAIIKRTVAEIQRDRITLTAAGVAFYWFLSLFPMLFAAIAIMSLVQVTPAFQQQLSDGISTAVPGQAADVLQQALGASQARVVASLPAVLIALAFALWSASSGMAATQIGLNVAYDVEEDRTFVKRRLIGLVLLAIALVLGGVAIGLIVFGQQIGDAVADAFSARGVFDVVWGVVRRDRGDGAVGLRLSGVLPVREPLRRQLREDLWRDRGRRHPVALAVSHRPGDLDRGGAERRAGAAAGAVRHGRAVTSVAAAPGACENPHP